MSLTRPRIILLLLFLLLASVGLRQRFAGEEPLSRSRILMGTVIEITASGPDRKALESALDAAFAEIARIEALMSPHLPQSEVARLSQSPEPLEVSPETEAVLRLGLEVAAVSGGAFDLGLGRLVELWRVAGERPRLPDAAEIRSALRGVGPDSLLLEGRMVAKADPELRLDLGGIAKGYAVDRAVEILRRAGATSASVNAGGDIGLLGERSGRPWRIGIQHPRNPGEVLAVLSLAGGAVVTSGDYQRFFEIDGTRYHHLFDPRTGHPATVSRSATVVGPSAALADALATAVFVLGPDQGLELLGEFPGYEGLVVAADGSVAVSERLRGGIEWR